MLNKRSIRSFLFSSRKIRALFSKLRMEEGPEGKIILIMAPHPDDDVIGCGGSILLHVKSGHQVHILYLTNGEHGIGNSDPGKASSIREKEGRKAALQLGVTSKHLHYLKLEDGKVSQQTGNNELLQTILNSIQPDTIYLPSFFESHPDHHAANLLLKNNLSRRVNICAYEVWTPLIPNLLINISEVMHQKQNALHEHASQLTAVDYQDAVTGLNRYRAAMFKKDVKYAEAFLFCNSEVYFQLM